MPGIRVKEGESFESALRRFKKKCEKAGVLADLRRHQHFEKPSERRKRKMNAAKRKNMAWTQIWLLVTGLLGAVFLFIELYEFAKMINEGAPPQRSAFLSAFFTLVGCHGAHVTAGLLWIGTMMAQIWAKGFQEHIMRRLLCLSVFWHALDIIWVAIFTIVYLIGTLQ